jgi:hypothetical protein
MPIRSLVRALFALLGLLALGGIADANGERFQNPIFQCNPILCPPDVTVVEDDRDQQKWDPNIGWYSAFAKGFTVRNIGNGPASQFHVAVYRGPDSYGFDIPSLAAGASQYYELQDLGCGENALILVNPFNALYESDYNNNAVTVGGWCNL